jgi:hypothetical protein
MTGEKKQETIKCKTVPPYLISSGLSGGKNGDSGDT